MLTLSVMNSGEKKTFRLNVIIAVRLVIFLRTVVIRIIETMSVICPHDLIMVIVLMTLQVINGHVNR